MAAIKARGEGGRKKNGIYDYREMTLGLAMSGMSDGKTAKLVLPDGQVCTRFMSANLVGVSKE